MYKRPVFLNLTKMHFPVTAIVSILHRVTGVIIFLSLPFLLYFLEQSLQSLITFNHMKTVLEPVLFRIIVWLISSAFIYHAFAGIRHLFMDIGCGESLTAGRISAWGVMLLTLVATILLGVFLLW